MKYILLFALSLLFVAGQLTAKPKTNLYIGTYTDGDSKGIYHYYFDTNKGTLKYIDVTTGIKNPSFLAISPDHKFLYSVAEGDSFNGEKGGGVAAFNIEKTGKLNKINDALSKGAYPCHVCVSPDGKTVVASNYGGGSIAIYNVLANGGISPIKQLIQHEGSGPDKEKRQLSAHAHSSQFNHAGTSLFTADLGIDKLTIYTPTKEGQFIAAQQAFVSTEPGAGPRHFAFTKSEDFIYLINELNSTITVLKKDKEEYHTIQNISTIPDDFKEFNACADIHISKDERFVYGSNRGHNSIAIFQRNPETGKLTFIGTEPVRGDWPRNFAIAPGGRFLLVANQKSNNITVFGIDPKSGKLTFNGTDLKLPSPVCLRFTNE